MERGRHGQNGWLAFYPYRNFHLAEDGIYVDNP